MKFIAHVYDNLAAMVTFHRIADEIINRKCPRTGPVLHQSCTGPLVDVNGKQTHMWLNHGNYLPVIMVSGHCALKTFHPSFPAPPVWSRLWKDEASGAVKLLICFYSKLHCIAVCAIEIFLICDLTAIWSVDLFVDSSGVALLVLYQFFWHREFVCY